MMTVLKAIKILDWLIESEQKIAEGFVDPTQSWNQNFDCMKDFAQTLAKCHKDNIQVFKIIKKELVVKCKHPKKMRDKSADGQRYCMNCNQDL